MNYPLISEYVESIKLAEDNFDELNYLRPVLDTDGQPVMSSGNFAAVFKMKDEPILAIYSHMIVDPLYLSAYPIGHLIDYQLENYLKDKNMGTEVCRIYKMGRLTPELWMERAVGQKLSSASLLSDTERAVKNLSAKKKK